MEKGGEQFISGRNSNEPREGNNKPQQQFDRKNIQYTHPTNEKLQQPILDIIDTYIIPTILHNINKLAQMAPGGKTTQTQNQ
jgi:hypothetical protein